MDQEEDTSRDDSLVSQDKISEAQSQDEQSIDRPEITDRDLCICYDCGDYIITWQLQIIHIPLGCELDDRENHVIFKTLSSNSCNEAGEFGLSASKMPVSCNSHSGKGFQCFEKRVITEINRVPRTQS